MKTILDPLFENAGRFPGKQAFIFLRDDAAGTAGYTYAGLARQVDRAGAVLRRRGLAGKKLLLLYPDAPEFIVAFLACQQVGAIAVPMYPPRGSAHADRVRRITGDVAPDAVCTTALYAERVGKLAAAAGLAPAPVVFDPLAEEAPGEESPAGESGSANPSGISFIQYTSGSTAHPKGVVVTHANLLHNQALIRAAFGCDAASVIGCWLPFYHDMGLIGNLLHAVYVGGTCVVLSPFAFFQRPVRWLEMISRYGVTHSGGPDFAYDLLVNAAGTAALSGIDLSAWRVAYNGSEPVRAATVEKFTAWARPYGFRAEAFYPCYGMAEATLLVAGAQAGPGPRTVSLHPDHFAQGDLVPVPETTPGAKRLVASGRVAEGMFVKILHPGHDAAYADYRIGEIAIAGESVFEQYWNGSPGAPGGRRTADGFFRTGDLGFTADGYLFVTGRSKEMIIIRGKNYFPHDLEHYAGADEAALEPGGVAAFAVEVDGYPELVVMAELKRTYAGRAAEIGPGLCQAIETKLVRETGLKPYDVVLVNPLAIPRTSSGKRKRLQCAAGYPAGPYLFAARTAAPPALSAGDPADAMTDLVRAARQEATGPAIRRYLGRVIAAKRPALPPHLAPDAELTEIGIDSLRALEIVNTINKDLQINLDVTQVYQANTVAGLVAAIETTLWLHHSATDHPAIGKGIII